MATAGTSGMNRVQRTKVLWFGPPPDHGDLREFKQRELVVECPDQPIQPEDHGQLLAVRGMVFKFNPDKPGALADIAQRLACLVINHGILVFAVASAGYSLERLRQQLGTATDSAFVILRTDDAPIHEIAERIARCNPGPAYNPFVEIKELLPCSLDEETRLFLRRAFGDCQSVLIEPLSGGKSATVFSVHAVLSDSVAGPRPLPFFVKVDELKKINQELDKYQSFASHFVQFNLRPNLVETRTVLGMCRGMLVGNFVERSESLWDVAQRGIAQQALHSLFDDAMRGWRRQGKVITGNIAKILIEAEVFKPSKITSARLQLAQRLGSTKSQDEIVQILVTLPDMDFEKGPTHGDLHAYNVRVRGNDAILIDFASAFNGPLAADPASLEVSLAFEASRGEKDNAGWYELMDALYDVEYLTRIPPRAKERKPREWLWECIRQIRRVALAEEVSKFEYALAVVVYLLRRAMYQADSQLDDERRAYAYVVAERLILKIAASLRV